MSMSGRGCVDKGGEKDEKDGTEEGEEEGMEEVEALGEEKNGTEKEEGIFIVGGFF